MNGTVVTSGIYRVLSTSCKKKSWVKCVRSRHYYRRAGHKKIICKHHYIISSIKEWKYITPNSLYSVLFTNECLIHTFICHIMKTQSVIYLFFFFNYRFKIIFTSYSRRYYEYSKVLYYLVWFIWDFRFISVEFFFLHQFNHTQYCY